MQGRKSKRMHIVKTGKRPANAPVSVGGYTAIILIEMGRNSRLYHWIIRRAGSARFLVRGFERSLEEAAREAHAYLLQQQLELSSRVLLQS